jgi:hypothetical protein
MSAARNTRTPRDGTGGRARVSWTAWGVAALASMATVTSAGTAVADETHTDSHNGHRITLISIGQIDDPAEDVLEHAAILGSETSTVG